MLTRCYRLAPGTALRRWGGRHLLVSAHPLRSLEVNAAAAALLAALDGETELAGLAQPVTGEWVAFLEGLAAADWLEGAYGLTAPPGKGETAPAVRVVIPAYGDAPGLAGCLAGLAEQDFPPARFRVVVVDDASPRPLEGETRVPGGLAGRVSWVRLPVNGGPGRARNAGAAAPEPGGGEAPRLLAFVDSDCVPEPGWVAGLAGVLNDPWVSAAGGRVGGLAKGRLLGRYEAACASLYMGERAGAVALPGGRVPYLPACNLGVARDAFLALGGFREDRRVGEDVDFCWRLAAAGQGIFYFPAAAVRHRYRDRWGPFLARKAAYGFSEAWLRGEHPGRFSGRGLWRFRVALLAAGGLGVAGQPLAGAAVLALPWLAALGGLGSGRGAFPGVGWGARTLAWVRRGAGGYLGAARGLARSSLVAWPAALVAGGWGAPASLPGALLAAAALFLLGAWAEWRARRPDVGAGVFLAGFGGECLAYSAGRVGGMAARARELFWFAGGLRRGSAPRRFPAP